MTFKEYMREVDLALVQVCGLTHSDLADYAYYDAYEAELEPREVALDVLSEEGFPFDD